MDIKSFLASAPTITRERASAINEVIDSGGIYITVNKRGNSKAIKLYYNNNGKKTVKQLKLCDSVVQWLKSKQDEFTASDELKALLNNE